ncbi:MAG TPA: MBG domain-containing protein [Puia sp.]|nr:MBG domain-containing protein [Puia sp.]
MVLKALIVTTLLTGLGTLGFGQPLVISPTTLPDAVYGSNYGNQMLSVTGGTAPYTFSISAGALPPGMNMDNNTGTINGKPNAAGSYSFTVMAVDNSNPTPVTGTQDYTLVVDQVALTITANDANMNYGGALPNLNVSYSGFVNGDNASSLTTPPSITTAPVNSPVGSYPITPSGAVDANYTISYVAGTLTIKPVPLMITANDASMTYGSAIPSLSVTYSGFVNGDVAANLTTPPSVSTTATSASSVGNYPITASGAADANYTITYKSGTLSIGKAPLTVTADNKSMPLGGPVPTLTVSYSGFVNGDDASSLAPAPTVTTTAMASSPAGSYPITPHGGGSPNYTFTFVNGTLTVAQAVLTITANPAGSVYGAPLVPAGSLTVSYSGFVNGDGPSSMTVAPTVTNSATPGSPAGNYNLVPSGAVNSNYIIQYVIGTYTINPAPLTIKANSASMTYGGSVPSLSVSYTGFVNGDDATDLTTQPTTTTSATAASPAGTYPITATGAVDPNYTISYQAGTMTVGKASLTVTADNKAMPLGGPIPPLTVSYSGFVNGDNASNLTTQPTATTTATVNSPAGGYPITPHGGVSPNYNFIYVNGTLAVAQAVLTITANPASSVYGAPLVPRGSLTVSYSGFVNGDGPSSMTVQPTVSNSAVAGSPVGSYNLTPSGAVNPNYVIEYATGVYTITPAPLTITANNQTMTYGGTVPALSATYSGFVNGDNVSRMPTPPTVTTTATSASGAGAYPITASGAVDQNYTITYNAGTLTINPAFLNVVANAETKKFGDPDPTFTYVASGYVNGDNSSIFTGNLSRAAGENVGVYPITIGSLSAGGNYTIRYTGNNLTITIGSQEISWNQSLIVGCNSSTQVLLNATASSGLPVTYTVSNPTVATVSGNVLTLLHPGTAVVTAHQAGDANHTAAPPVGDTLLYEATSLISQHWNDAIFFDNSSGDYVAWQWYKNDTLIAGATQPYYSETPTLDGQYFVIATNNQGQEVQSCTLSISPGSAIPGGIKVQPNPIGKGQMATITCNYSSAALQGAVLQILDLSGKVLQQVTSVQPSMQLAMPSANGIYVITLQLANGARASVNVLVD